MSHVCNVKVDISVLVYWYYASDIAGYDKKRPDHHSTGALDMITMT